MASSYFGSMDCKVCPGLDLCIIPAKYVVGYVWNLVYFAGNLDALARIWAATLLFVNCWLMMKDLSIWFIYGTWFACMIRLNCLISFS
jgi:hypothetical protein